MPKFWNGMSEKIPSGNEVLMVGDPNAPSTPKYALFSKVILYLKTIFVEKIAGKSLSTNDFDNNYKTKVDDAITIDELNVATTETPSGNGTGFRLKSDLNTEINANYQIADYFVTPGQTKYLSGTAGVGYALAFAFDANSFPQSAILPNGSDAVTDYEYIIPAGIYALRICGTVANPPKCKVITQKYALKSDLSTKVDKVNGKGLSENDFTSTLLAKLNAAITQIKTINNTSLLGTGNINIQGGGGGGITTEENYKYFEDIHFWQVEIPTGAVNGDIWYNPTTKELKQNGGGIWDDLGEKSYYVFTYQNNKFIFDGTELKTFGFSDNYIENKADLVDGFVDESQIPEMVHDVTIIHFWQDTNDQYMLDNVMSPDELWYNPITKLLKKNISGVLITISLQNRMIYKFENSLYIKYIGELINPDISDKIKKQIKLAM